MNYDLLRPTRDRLLQRLRESIAIDARTGCWVWQKATHKFGYGKFCIGHARHFHAHRISWMLHHKRAVPRGKRVLHTCDNPPCCNPQHLYAGTQKKNIHDMLARGRHKPGGTKKGQRAFLTYELAEKMRSRRKAGALLRELVLEFKCSISMVHNILRRQQFAHPPKPGHRYRRKGRS